MSDPASNPRSRAEDLTARARIRNAALDLYATHGEDRVSMRTVAAEVGVTVGLVQHHFGTKDGLRAAVDELVVEYFRDAMARATAEDADGNLMAARNQSVRDMLAANPEVAQYLRRAWIDPNGRGHELVSRLMVMVADEIDDLRTAGHISTRRSRTDQGLRMAMSQVGEVFLEPLVATMWTELGGPVADIPTVRITVEN